MQAAASAAANTSKTPLSLSQALYFNMLHKQETGNHQMAPPSYTHSLSMLNNLWRRSRTCLLLLLLPLLPNYPIKKHIFVEKRKEGLTRFCYRKKKKKL